MGPGSRPVSGAGDSVLVCRWSGGFGGEARPVQGNRQAEIPYLGDSVGGQLDVARLEVPVHDAPPVGKLQAPACFLGNLTSRLSGDIPIDCKDVWGSVMSIRVPMAWRNRKNEFAP